MAERMNLWEAVGAMFGLSIRRPDKDEYPAFAPKIQDDGAVVAPAGSNYGTYIDFDGTVRTEAEIVSKYRDMSLHPEIDNAVDNIVNEAIVTEENEQTVEVILDNVEISTSLKKVIENEFEEALRLLEFNVKPYDVFRRWYIDGRLYYEIIVDQEKLQEGIKELRYLDPRKIRKIREVAKKRDAAIPGLTTPKIVAEYYLYSDKALATKGRDLMPQTTSMGIKIALDSVVHVTSGITDTNHTMVLGHMHKAIRGLNQLRVLEDAAVIYRLSRAPERRIFYIDVGSMPKIKAEQHMKEMMTKHRNKLVYDLESGTIRDDRKFMTMIEDYWIARREGSKSTEIDTLPAGEHLGEMGDIDYFKRKLYESLNVPVSRLDPEAVYNVGRSSQISRDEVNFGKFIDRMRTKFGDLFLQILEKQLILKEVFSPDEWDHMKNNVRFRFLRDNYFSELKDGEIQMDRFTRLEQAVMYAGKYFSHEWVRKTILQQTDDEMAEEDKQIKVEEDMEQYQNVNPMDQQQDGGFNDFGEPVGGAMPAPFTQNGAMNGSTANGSDDEKDDGKDKEKERGDKKKRSYETEESELDKQLKTAVIEYLEEDREE